VFGAQADRHRGRHPGHPASILAYATHCKTTVGQKQSPAGVDVRRHTVVPRTARPQTRDDLPRGRSSSDLALVPRGGTRTPDLTIMSPGDIA